MMTDELSRGRPGLHMYRTIGCSIANYCNVLQYSDKFRCIQRYAGFAQDPSLGAERCTVDFQNETEFLTCYPKR